MTDQANRPVAEITGDLDRLCIDTIRTLSMGAVQGMSHVPALSARHQKEGRMP